MKYIDAEKLIAEIEKKRKILISEYKELAKYEVWKSAKENEIKIYTINDILFIISSLQLEQPEADLEKEIKKCQEHYILVKEKGFSLDWMDIETTARHFYELGLNARKDK